MWGGSCQLPAVQTAADSREKKPSQQPGQLEKPFVRSAGPHPRVRAWRAVPAQRNGRLKKKRGAVVFVFGGSFFLFPPPRLALGASWRFSALGLGGGIRVRDVRVRVRVRGFAMQTT
jgi:hypothetical protein